jgi:hypothetical protein
MKALVIHNTNTDYTCGLLHACPKTWIELSFDDYAKVLNKFKSRKF